ncbi:UGSC family (seleno)protein [Dactylosporangium sp. CA-092794]|uniref:UGSC family (seleno)protein n=1 Tax=Dactylosporangium sp. CA-092794 TaxID=3239929 RepID=UPI003D94941C
MTATRIYRPDSDPAPEPTRRAAAPAGLAGLRVAVVDNGKPNAGLVMARLAETLSGRARTRTTVVTKKGPAGRSANAAIPAAPDIVERVVAGADLVITGSADCGSCTAYSVYDAIEFERRGLPAVVVTTTKFEPIARSMAVHFGLPGTRILVLPHPFGATDAATLRSWADAAVEDLAGLYLDAAR